MFSAQGWELIMKENICNVHSTCVAWWISHYVTGQLISKGLFGILNSSKKGTKQLETQATHSVTYYDNYTAHCTVNQ